MGKPIIIYLFACLFFIIVAFISFDIYQYREQNLGDVMDIDRVVKVHYREFNKDSNRKSLLIDDKETINQLANFFKQYQVKSSKQEGWISENIKGQIDFLFEYKDGSSKPYTFDGDIIASYSIYKVVNDAVDYEWIREMIEQPSLVE